MHFAPPVFVPDHPVEFAAVAIKAALLYLTAVVAFRLSKRRTLAEMAPFDFIAAVAAGAIVGRVPNATGTTYVAGAITLLSILLLHAIITWLRSFTSLSRMVDHRPMLLFAQGQILDEALRACGLTRNDLFGQLRGHGVSDLKELRFVVFEQRGRISIIRRTPGHPGEAGLISDILSQFPEAQRLGGESGRPAA